MTEQRVRDRQWLQMAIDLSRKCPPRATRYAVGAVIVASDGRELSRGYSREGGPHVHAEESALAKLTDSGADLSQATIYSSLEPCSVRRSHPRTCTQLILDAGIRRVVIALREPLLLADCHGVELLQAAEVHVIEIPELAKEVKAINAHLLGPDGSQ